jgi:DNA polymerase
MSMKAPVARQPDALQQRLEAVRLQARSCTNCDLYANATQTVFGEGPMAASMLLVGEQPGDQEDEAGVPFVGPAGVVLDKALDAAGIDQGQVYVTNAVKHFRWIPRGKKRIHQRPNVRQVRACLPWLETEIELVQPDVLVCLGAVAAQALLGPKFLVTQQRGKPVESPLARTVMATIHPSSVLRQADSEARREAFDSLVADLKAAARYAQ